MTKQSDDNAELRAAYTMRLLEDAKRSVQPEPGAIGVFMRVTLALIFLYLIVISYMMLGTDRCGVRQRPGGGRVLRPLSLSGLYRSAGKAQGATREP